MWADDYEQMINYRWPNSSGLAAATASSKNEC